MRFSRTIALVGVALLWWGCGPVVPIVALAALGIPRVRAWLRPTWRVVAIWAASVIAVTGLAIVVPDSWMPIPSASGRWITPEYVGRPARGEPAAGPLGESPQVRTRSYGVDGCRRVAVDSHARLLSVCGDADAPVLRLVDPESLRQLATKDLPVAADSRCFGAFVLDRDRAVVATNDQRLLVVRTADGDGDPDLTTQSSVSLADTLADDDCVVGLGQDTEGRTWFVSRSGLVGTVTDGQVRALDLAEQVSDPLTVDDGAAYVATAKTLSRVEVGPMGKPRTVWTSTADDPGPPAVRSGLVAVADGSDPSRLVVRSTADGSEVCTAEVAGDPVVAAATGFVVQDTEGYGGSLSTVLGRTTSGGLARVDVVDGRCRVTWRSDLDAPSGFPAVSVPSGLVYAVTKRHSWLGVDAWYLSALDLATGRTVFAVRTGLGVLHDNHRGSVTIGPDGSAYVPVLGGLVRVHDRD